jgi:hypothetical protein
MELGKLMFLGEAVSPRGGEGSPQAEKRRVSSTEPRGTRATAGFSDRETQTGRREIPCSVQAEEITRQTSWVKKIDDTIILLICDQISCNTKLKTIVHALINTSVREKKGPL